MTESPFLIGRGTEAGNHLPLVDKRISRRCAALIYADGAFRLEDRGQRDGLFVNNQKVETHLLREGDTITFGEADSVQLVFHTGQGRASLSKTLAKLGQASELDAGARDLRQLSLLLEATAMLQSQLPLEEVLAAMVDRAVTITNADRGLLLEADSKGQLQPLLARRQGAVPLTPANVQPSQTAVARALSRRRSVVEGDLAQAAGPLRDAQSVVAQELRAVIAIPLLSLAQPGAGDATYVSAPGDLLGLLYLDSRCPAAFSGLELQILDALAHEAASVLDNARLVQKERERQRMEQELSIAREIQQALLPKTLQPFRHVQVRGMNRSCLAVGGDYYDLVELGQDRAAFIIADVSGKGLSAALVTSMLQGTFTSISLGQDPARVFAHVNHFICSHSEVRRYATLFLGILDAGGRVEYSNCGHLCPLLVRQGRVEPVFGAGSLPLGMLPQTAFKTESSNLEPGDTLVLYTDGITEAMNRQDDQFGDERLCEVVARHAHSTLEKMEAAILAAVAEFMHGAEQSDDITLLLVRYLGHPAPSNSEPPTAVV